MPSTTFTYHWDADSPPMGTTPDADAAEILSRAGYHVTAAMQ